jgi:hypothetical protein
LEDLVSSLNICQWFSVKEKEKLKMRKEIYDFLISELNKKGIVFYKGVGFKVLNGQERILIESERARQKILPRN